MQDGESIQAKTTAEQIMTAEQMKLEADIVERARKQAGHHIDNQKMVSGKLLDELADEIERLRAERPTWREGIEAAAKVVEHFAELDPEAKVTERYFLDAISRRIRALTHPSIGVDKEE